MEIKGIFDKIEKDEGHTFVINEMYTPVTTFTVPDENGDDVKVVGMIIKETETVDIEFANGHVLGAANIHMLRVPMGLTYVKDLSIGDTINGETIVNITSTGTNLVYDLNVDSVSHLYKDASGIVHHNTYHINKKLKEILGNDYIYHSGVNASPYSFYNTLFQERKDIIVFDEADDLLIDKQIVMMLKPLLDTSGDNTAEYLKNTQSMTGKSEAEVEEFSDEVDIEIHAGQIPGQKGDAGVLLPSKFYFKGGMIFISNMRADKIDQAIMSRSMFVDVHLAEQDVQKRIRTILDLGVTEDVDAGLLTYTKNDVSEVMAALSVGAAPDPKPVRYMTPLSNRANKQITVRAGMLGIVMLKSGLKDWKRLCGMYA